MYTHFALEQSLRDEYDTGVSLLLLLLLLLFESSKDAVENIHCSLHVLSSL